MANNIDIDKPLWNLKSFSGRFMHFFWVTDPRTCFTSEKDLIKAKELVLKDSWFSKTLSKFCTLLCNVQQNFVTICKPGPERSGSQPADVSIDEIIHAKKLYESAFHPDSGELQNIFGRMSFQMPGGMAITGAMLQWYRTNTAVIFWQWVNQSFNALVNYTNRNANSSLTTTQLVVSYVSATSSALLAAVGYKGYLTKKASPFFQRYVPFVAVAVANCINIPLMRQNELIYGIDIQDENGNTVGKSRVAAAKGISQVVFSRIAMCAPGMLILPIIMEKLEKHKSFRSISFLHAPFQVVVVGCFLTVMVPTACALFPQTASISTGIIKVLEPEFYEDMRRNGKIPSKVYFNKGL